MDKYKTGYYWVQLVEDNEWWVAFHNKYGWTLFCSNLNRKYYKNDEFEKYFFAINGPIIEPKGGDVSKKFIQEENINNDITCTATSGNHDSEFDFGYPEQFIKKFNWEPWEEYIIPYVPDLINEIKEPPCKNCKHWKPHRVFDKSLLFDGVACCTSIEDMERDFSCFKSK